MIIINKKRIITGAIALVIALTLLFVFIIPMISDFADVPVSEDAKEVVITIEENTSTLGIGNILKENGLIRSCLAFVLKVKTSDYSGKLSNGTYTLSPSMTIEEICAKLSEKKPVRQIVTITFPEGYSVEQMAKSLEENKLVSRDAFIKALSDSYDYDFIKEIPKDKEYSYKLQGFLFPDTYEFYTDSSAHEIVDRMLSRFNEVYFSMASDDSNIFDIITKASMIEKEAKLESERPIIAGVIENRIVKEMPFQIDATVLYAATEGLYNEEDSSFIANNIRSMDSPYNTYIYSGLPAGPICNPGITSIKAALEPQEHEYLFYHTDTDKNDGSHIFTKTYEEHLHSMEQ